MDMKKQRFGIEVELTGITREKAAQVAAEHFGTTARYDGTYYNVYSALDNQGRKWQFVSDASITAERKVRNRMVEADGSYKTEMVSPICYWEDIETVQELVRKLRVAGAIANSSCGIHVHVDSSAYDANKLRNITNIMASKEDLIYKALEVSVARQHRWCKPVDNRFLDELNQHRPRTLDEISRMWYNGSSRSDNRYDKSRYHCLNLHSVFQKGTVEFRLFNGTTHAGKIKAYVQFCLAISAQALNQRCASRVKTQTTNEKYTFRTWLLRLGMIGDEFKTAREHLLKPLTGCIAWKDPAQAEQQKERMRLKKEKALSEENQVEQSDEIQPTEEAIEQAEVTTTSALTMNM